MIGRIKDDDALMGMRVMLTGASGNRVAAHVGHCCFWQGMNAYGQLIAGRMHLFICRLPVQGAG